jgi:beta-phosphoglucomutase family hydrolase
VIDRYGLYYEALAGVGSISKPKFLFNQTSDRLTGGQLRVRNKAAIWDVDGTLVDTAEQHYAAWVEIASELAKPFGRSEFAATFGRRNPEIIRAVFDSEADDAAVAEIGERKEVKYRSAAQAQGVSLLPGVGDLLEQLRVAGWLQAIGSSAPRANLDLILKLTNTRSYFSALVSAEDTARGKPDPQVFQIAAERLRVPPQNCVVFEDAVAGVEAARAAGMKCVAITAVGHHSPDALRAAGGDCVVESLSELSATDVERLMS